MSIEDLGSSKRLILIKLYSLYVLLLYISIFILSKVTDPPPNLRESTTGLLRHLKAKLRNSEAYYTMKLMLVGRANRGKTTLMHRLDKDFAFNQNQSTKGEYLIDE